MEIMYIIAILVAFLLGAFVRKPFFIVKKDMNIHGTEKKTEYEEKKFTEQFNNLLNYTGNKQGGDGE